LVRLRRRKPKESIVMNAKWAVRCLGVLLALAPLTAFAQEAFTRQPTDVRAGPDGDYPMVYQLGPGSPVRVMGCLEDWTWCDVAFDDNRGWVYGPYLLYGVQDDRVPLYTYGPSLGIAIVAFSLGTYWDDHYRQRPWYSGREDWARRTPPPHRVPSGLPPHAVYAHGVHVDRGAPAKDARSHDATTGRTERPGNAAPQEHAQQHSASEAAHHQEAATQQRTPQAATQRAPEHAPPAAHEDSKANPQHEQPAAQHEAPHTNQNAPQHEAAQGREGGGEKGGGEKGGGEKGGGEKSSHDNNR
jgi:uncharacterized protein YraI